MKRLYIMHVDQRKTLHKEMLIVDTTFKEISDIDKELKNSHGLQQCFIKPEVKEIALMLVVFKTGEVRRHIAGSGIVMDRDQVQQLFKNMAARVGIDIIFHDSKDEMRKIVPMNKADRDDLKKMLSD